MGMLLAIGGITVLFVILWGVQTIMEPFDNAFADSIERLVSWVERELGDAPTLIVPFQVGSALVAAVSVVLWFTAGVAGFFLGLVGLVAAGCLYDLSRRLSLRAEYTQASAAPRPGLSQQPVTRTPTAAASSKTIDAEHTAKAEPQPLAMTTYTTTPPTAEAVRRHVRLGELQQQASHLNLSPEDQAELELLMANDADTAD